MRVRFTAWRRAAATAAFVVASAQVPAGQPPAGAPRPPQPALPRLGTHTEIPLALFKVPEGFEVTLWANSPMVRNPTNIDIDRDGRFWVAEGVR